MKKTRRFCRSGAGDTPSKYRKLLFEIMDLDTPSAAGPVSCRTHCDAPTTCGCGASPRQDPSLAALTATLLQLRMIARLGRRTRLLPHSLRRHGRPARL